MNDKNTQNQAQTLDQLYYVDPTVLSFFLKLDDPKKIEDAYLQYSSIINQIISDAFKYYLKNKNLPETQQQEIFKRYEDLMDTTEEMKDTDFKAMQPYLDDPEFQTIISDILNRYNKIVYDRYTPQMSQEDKDSLNEYLEQMEAINKGGLTLISNLATVLETLKSVPQPSPNAPRETVSQAAPDGVKQDVNAIDDIATSPTVTTQSEVNTLDTSAIAQPETNELVAPETSQMQKTQPPVDTSTASVSTTTPETNPVPQPEVVPQPETVQPMPTVEELSTPTVQPNTAPEDKSIPAQIPSQTVSPEPTPQEPRTQPAPPEPSINLSQTE